MSDSAGSNSFSRRAGIATIGALSAIAFLLGIYFSIRHFAASAEELVSIDSAASNVLLLISVGVAFSAVFIALFQAREASRTFRESLRPRVLVQIENQKARVSEENPALVPVSLLHYRNHSTNDFRDLRLHLEIDVGNLRSDASSLFRGPMIFPAGDTRRKKILPYSDLPQFGVHLESHREDRPRVLLTITCSYSFFGEEEQHLLQKYLWDYEREEWEIY